jgi:amino acid transporter
VVTFSLGSCPSLVFLHSSSSAVSLSLTFASVKHGKSLQIPTQNHCLTIIRKLQGHSVDELPFRAKFGVIGSYICAIMNFICLAAQFYVALYPVGGPNLSPTIFFQDYLAGPFLIVLYAGWKIYSWYKVPEHRPLYVKIRDIDIYTGMRPEQSLVSGQAVPEETRRASVIAMQEEEARRRKGPLGIAKRVLGAVF